MIDAIKFNAGEMIQTFLLGLTHLDQIHDFRRQISYLAETNPPLLDEKWLKFQAWIWSP